MDNENMQYVRYAYACRFGLQAGLDLDLEVEAQVLATLAEYPVTNVEEAP